MNKQVVSVRLTKEANRILAQWKKKYGGLNKSQTILRVNGELVTLEPYREKYGGLNQDW